MTFAQMLTQSAEPKPESRTVRAGPAIQPFGAMAPCVPASPGRECEQCARFRETAGMTDNHVHILTIDASTVKRAGETCRMLA